MTTEPREQQEPSMEEILSSIRRIIADEDAPDDGTSDDELGAAEAAAEGADDDAEPAADAGEDEESEEDVLELTRVVREGGEVVDLQSERSPEPEAEAGEPAEPVFAGHGAEHESAPDEHDYTEASEHAARMEAPQESPEIDATQHKDKPVPREQARNSELVSGSAATMATGAFAKLSQALQRTPEEESVADSSGRTVEQFVEDMVRPLLKQWLDDNLPPIVERLVQKEIQKIARRAELI